MQMIKADLTSAISATSTGTGYNIDDVLDRKPWTLWKAGGTSSTISVTFSAAIDALYIGGIDAASIRVYLKTGAGVTQYDTGVLSSPDAKLWIDAPNALCTKADIVLTHATAASVSIVFGGEVIEGEGNIGLAWDYKDSAIVTDLYKPETTKNIIEGFKKNGLRFATFCEFDDDGFPELVSACRDASPWPMPVKPWPTRSDYVIFGAVQASGSKESESLARVNISIEEWV